MEVCNKVLLDHPDDPGALYVSGCVLLSAQRHTQAIQCGKRICELCPRDPRGWGLLALIYGELHRYDESLAMADKAVACKRTDKTLSELAYAYTNCGEWAKGEAAARESVVEAERNPTSLARVALRDSLISLAYCRLGMGDWKAGFEGFRLTLRTKWRKEWTYGNSQEWMGEPDAVVMVTGEQGLGDEIMAASVIPDAIKHCQTFILDCDHRLVKLFRRSFPGAIVTPTRREDTIKLPVLPTHHKSMFGLSELFRCKDEDFPRTAYLKPNADYVRMFHALLERPTIGIAWSGGLPRTGMEQRKAGLNAFLPLIRRGGQFVSLEYKDDAQEVAEFEKQHGIRIKRLPWVTQGQDMDLLAGLLASLTETVGVHTSALHLAAAVGTPTTFIAHRGSGWRYGPPELLWYGNTAQMHKKRSGESWRDCVGRLAEARK